MNNNDNIYNKSTVSGSRDVNLRSNVNALARPASKVTLLCPVYKKFQQQFRKKDEDTFRSHKVNMAEAHENEGLYF